MTASILRTKNSSLYDHEPDGGKHLVGNGRQLSVDGILIFRQARHDAACQKVNTAQTVEDVSAYLKAWCRRKRPENVGQPGRPS